MLELFSKNTLIFVLICSNIIFLAIIIVQSIRAKRDLIISQFETEQRISRKLHDEIANDVFFLMNKAEIIKDSSQADLVDSLEEIYYKTRDLSRSFSEINVSDNFNIVLLDLISSFKNEKTNVFTRNLNLDFKVLNKNQLKVLYRAIQELLINIKKHSNASLVTVSFEKKKGNIIIEIADNGIGIGEIELSKRGNGLRNVENRLAMVNGKFSLKSKLNEGVTAEIKIPVN